MSGEHVDSILGGGIGLFILSRAYRSGREAVRALLQIEPQGFDHREEVPI